MYIDFEYSVVKINLESNSFLLGYRIQDVKCKIKSNNNTSF